MPKNRKPHVQISDEKRKELLLYIYDQKMNIMQAARAADIYYPTAKAINAVFVRERRVDKKVSRDRKRVTYES